MSRRGEEFERLLRDRLPCVRQLRRRPSGWVAIDSLFSFPDGDGCVVYASPIPGGVRFSDRGHSLMRLSYSIDVDKLQAGSRGRVFQRVLANHGMREEGGELLLDCSLDDIPRGFFSFSQALTRIHDLGFVATVRRESTFYVDLAEVVTSIVPAQLLRADYAPEIENGSDYVIDYRIEGKSAPVFLFGVPNRDKARLATITLERLLRETMDFESLVIFENQETLPRGDLARLTNAAGEMVSSLGAQSDIRRKIIRRAAVN